ncbi:NAD(P)/FAD-dependent oxidoreductase [Pseudoroseomonas globiformis]|uniref:NAD(P)/FAD-dependent oxidoreductase n=1 Tax=Teichococcus globiformis TaxID=2307229 RepID=A0ABV7FYS5_9PROT
MNPDLFTPDFVERPYWWELAPPPPANGLQPLPETADVVIIGGGIAGLSTAIELGRSGVKALVLDREAIGWGASSRNGGALSGAGSLGRARSDLHTLDARLLEEMVEEAESSFDDFETFLRREGVECCFRKTGRFVGAHAPKALDTLKRRAEMLNRTGRDTATVLERGRVHEEVATDLYHGGLLIERAGSLHPGLYVQGLAEAALGLGSELRGGITVTGLEKDGTRHRVHTSLGEVAAGQVMVATNGYTGEATPWHRRRLVPVASYMIATEPLGEERVRALLPRLRVYGDTKKVLYYFRPSPDFTRILFGGRASFIDAEATRSAARLHGFLTGLMPELAGMRVTHGWKGNVAFAFDYMPHVGQQDGIHYALGCNGSGVVTMTHLGRCAARQMLGAPNRASAFSRMPFPTMRGYSGRPWFLPLVGASYQLRDRMDGWRSAPTKTRQ